MSRYDCLLFPSQTMEFTQEITRENQIVRAQRLPFTLAVFFPFHSSPCFGPIPCSCHHKREAKKTVSPVNGPIVVSKAAAARSEALFFNKAVFFPLPLLCPSLLPDFVAVSEATLAHSWDLFPSF